SSVEIVVPILPRHGAPPRYITHGIFEQIYTFLSFEYTAPGAGSQRIKRERTSHETEKTSRHRRPGRAHGRCPGEPVQGRGAWGSDHRGGGQLRRHRRHAEGRG